MYELPTPKGDVEPTIKGKVHPIDRIFDIVGHVFKIPGIRAQNRGGYDAPPYFSLSVFSFMRFSLKSR